MRTTRRLLAVGVLGLVALGLAGGAEALTPGTYVCWLGGNTIVVTMEITQQGNFFQAVGQWDDASLQPFLPVYGALVIDPNWGIVGGLTQVGFSKRPLPGAPFGKRPRGFHVQFRLAEAQDLLRAQLGNELVLVGSWADDGGSFGTMICTPTPPGP